MKAYFVNSAGQTMVADVPDDVSPSGIDIGSPCHHHATSRIRYINRGAWMYRCEVEQHELPERFVKVDGDDLILMSRGAKEVIESRVHEESGGSDVPPRG